MPSQLRLVLMCVVFGELLASGYAEHVAYSAVSGANESVPSVIGLSAKDARAALEAAGLTPKFQLGKSAARPGEVNTVYAVDPAAGTTVAKGSIVQLTIHSGSAQITGPSSAINPPAKGAGSKTTLVPSILGASVKDAKAAITAVGLTPTFVQGSPSDTPAAELTVYDQRPAPGGAAVIGAPVTLTFHPRVGVLASASKPSQSELSEVRSQPFLNQFEEVVDPRSGRVSVTASDLVVPAGAIYLEVRRSRQLVPGASGLLGTRWRLNWETRLSQFKDRVVIESEGRQLAFAWDDAARRYVSPFSGYVVVEADRARWLKPQEGITDTFDKQGRLIERDGRNGNKITLVYDADGRLASIAGPRGSWLQMRCDEQGRLIEIESSNGSHVAYSYSPAQQPVTNAPDKDGLAVRYVYDEKGLLQSIIHPRAGAMRLSYDGKGRVLSRNWASGTREEFAYDDDTNTLRHVDRAGRVTITRWSKDGRIQEKIDPLGNKTITNFNELGRPVQIAGPSGQIARLQYDRLERIETVTDGMGRPTKYEYLGDTELITTKSLPDGPQQSFKYDAQMNLVEHRLGTERVLERMYYPDGLIRTAKQLGKPEQRFTYDAEGRPATISDPWNNQERFEYDRHGNLIRVVNSAGATTTWAYDSNDRLQRFTDATGKTTQHAYSDRGDLISTTDPSGHVVRFEYDSVGRPISQIDPTGNRETYDYDSQGRLTATHGPDGRQVSYRYDANGNLTATEDATGPSWTFSYDAAGRLIGETGPLGHARRWRYDAAGRIVETRDALDRKTEYVYDEQGRLASVRDPSGRTQQLEYGADGRLLATVDTAGKRLAMNYDEFGRVTGVNSAAGQLLKVEFEAGQVSKSTGPSGSSVSYSYDHAGQRNGLSYANGEQTRFTHNSLGQVAEAADGLGQVWKLAYTPLGQLGAMTSPNGSEHRYTYTAAGQLESIVDPRGNVRRFEYDWRGRRIAEVDPLKRTAETSFGLNGKVAIVKSPGGQVTRSTYDVLGRLIETSGPGGTAARFEYDAVGNVTTEVCGEYRATYRYDELDRLVEATYLPIKTTIRYGYDDAGRRSTLAVEGIGQWAYRYDNQDRLVELSDFQNRVTRFSYDDAGRVVGEVLPNGVNTRREYDGRGRVRELSAHVGTDQFILRRRYDYNAAGNLIKEAREGSAELQYQYDAEDRLVDVRRAGEAEHFDYDAVGNRLRPDGNAKYDAADQLQAFEGEVFEFDDQGRLRVRRKGNSRREYEYGSGGRIAAVKSDGKVVAEYRYDARGRRIWKKVDGRTTHYVYDGQRILLELSESLEAERIWTPGPELDRPTSFVVRNQVFYPISDSIGSLVALTDQTGAVTARWDYHPFGGLREHTNAGELGAINLFGFAGGQYDPESGLYYFRARYYDPALGRFLTRDPLLGKLTNPASLHPYQYAYNNPLRYRDPSGAANQDISSAILDPAGEMGATMGGMVAYAVGTGLNKLDQVSTSMHQASNPDFVGISSQQRDNFAQQISQDMGRPAGDAAARMAVGMATAPAHVGTGFGDASVAVQQGWNQARQGDYVNALDNFGSAALSAAGDVGTAAGTAAGGVRGWRGLTGAASSFLNPPPPKELYAYHKPIIEILDPNQPGGGPRLVAGAWGRGAWASTTQSKGSGVRDALAIGKRPSDLQDTIEFVFKGDAAAAFQPHPISGPVGTMKRLGGQHFTGVGDLKLVDWEWSHTGQVVVTKVQLVPHNGTAPKLAGIFTPEQRAWLGPAGDMALGTAIAVVTGIPLLATDDEPEPSAPARSTGTAKTDWNDIPSAQTPVGSLVPTGNDLAGAMGGGGLDGATIGRAQDVLANADIQQRAENVDRQLTRDQQNRSAASQRGAQRRSGGRQGGSGVDWTAVGQAIGQAIQQSQQHQQGQQHHPGR